jgi:hypothetical protein
MHDPVIDGATAQDPSSAITIWSQTFELQREGQR